MKIEIDRLSKIPVYLQVYNQIKTKIQSGEMPAGYRLPSERQLAENLGVNRTTIVNAYRELRAENLIGSHVGRGSVVLKDNDIQKNEAYVSEPAWSHLFSGYASKNDIYNYSNLITSSNSIDRVSFATGIASPNTLPIGAFSDFGNLISDNNTALLQSPVEGFSSLRKTMAQFMQQRGCYCNPEEVMLLAGLQQGIELATKMFLDPGDIVVMEEPTFLPAIQTFKNSGARIITIPVVEDGMQTDLLEQLLQRNRPKLIYTMPSFHNPSGVEMSFKKRKHLLELAQKYKSLIIEDDAYIDLYYDEISLPTLKSMDRAGYVIYLGSFSKTVCSGLRLGWVVAHRKIIQKFVSAKQLMDLHPNCLSQLFIEHFIKSGEYEKHLDMVRIEYTQQRNAMQKALQKYSRGELSWIMPRGGYYFWCGLPEGVGAIELTREIAERNVAIIPGNLFFPSIYDNSHIRLNFTSVNSEAIEQGIQIFCQTIRKLVAKKSESITPDLGVNPII